MMRDIFPLHCTSLILLKAGTDEVDVLSHARQMFALAIGPQIEDMLTKSGKYYLNEVWLLLFPHICLRMEFYNFSISFKTSWSKSPVNLHI